MFRKKMRIYQIWTNENNKSFYPRDMFEFIHHPKYGCCDHKRLKFTFIKNDVNSYLYGFTFEIN
jgi:hypothetical protein